MLQEEFTLNFIVASLSNFCL